MTGADIVAAARRYTGTPWRHQGRTAAGMDCAGLILAVAQDLGIPHPDRLAYARLPNTALIDGMLELYCEPVEDPAPGDVMRFSIMRRPQHLAVAADYPGGRLSMIHAYQTIGSVCEHRLDDKWRRRLAGCYRIKGVC